MQFISVAAVAAVMASTVYAGKTQCNGVNFSDWVKTQYSVAELAQIRLRGKVVICKHLGTIRDSKTGAGVNRKAKIQRFLKGVARVCKSENTTEHINAGRLNRIKRTAVCRKNRNSPGNADDTWQFPRLLPHCRCRSAADWEADIAALPLNPEGVCVYYTASYKDFKVFFTFDDGQELGVHHFGNGKKCTGLGSYANGGDIPNLTKIEVQAIHDISHKIGGTDLRFKFNDETKYLNLKGYANSPKSKWCMDGWDQDCDSWSYWTTSKANDGQREELEVSV